MKMNLTNKQKQELSDYEGNYGIENTTKTLFKIMIENNLIKPTEMVGPILNILLNEDLPHYNDENVGTILDINHIKSQPELLRKIVDKNYHQYTYKIEGEI